MSDLRNSEDPSPVDVITAQKQFTRVFAERYPTCCQLQFYRGSLDEAVTSMFNTMSVSLFVSITL